MGGRRERLRRCGLTGAVLVLGLVGPVVHAGPASAETISEQQWHLAALRVTEAHRLSTGKGVIVAVVDTGVQADHPDLAGQVLDGVRITGEDDKGKVDRDNHGTGVAGLIAARGGGPNHALGIAPGAKILPVGVAAGALGGSDLAKGVRWAVDHHASIINVSVGASRATDEVTEAVRYALDHDVVVVAAAGNLDSGDAGIGSPASIPGVIAVSAVDRRGAFWSGSVRGPQMGLAAPGTEIVTLANQPPDSANSGYIRVDGGTSAAAPIVAGAAALVRAKYPELHAPDVVNRLVTTAKDAGPDGRDEQYGFGEVDLVRALTADVPAVSANPLGVPTSAPAAPDSGSGDRGPLLLIVGVLGVIAVLVVVVAVVMVLMLSRRRTRRG